MSTSLIQVRVEDSLKIKATQIYSDLGLGATWSMLKRRCA